MMISPVKETLESVVVHSSDSEETRNFLHKNKTTPAEVNKQFFVLTPLVFLIKSPVLVRHRYCSDIMVHGELAKLFLPDCRQPWRILLRRQDCPRGASALALTLELDIQSASAMPVTFDASAVEHHTPLQHKTALVRNATFVARQMLGQGETDDVSRSEAVAIVANDKVPLDSLLRREATIPMELPPSVAGSH